MAAGIALGIGRGALALGSKALGATKSVLFSPWNTAKVATASAAGTGLLMADNQTGNVASKALWDSADAVGLAKLYFTGTTFMARQLAAPVANIAKAELMESGVINKNTDTDISNNLILAGAHYLTGDKRGAVLLASNMGINELDFLAAIKKAQQDNPDGDVKNTVISTYSNLEAHVREVHLADQATVSEDLETVDTPPSTSTDEQASPGSVAGTQGAGVLAAREKQSGVTNPETQPPLDTVIAGAKDTFSAVAEEGAEIAQDKAEEAFSLSSLFNFGSLIKGAVVFAIAGVIGLINDEAKEDFQRWALGDDEVNNRVSDLNADGENGLVTSQLGQRGLFGRTFGGPSEDEPEFVPS